MTIRFHVTYELVTPESAEQGDAEERGYCDAQGNQYALDNCSPDDIAACTMSLREARNLMPGAKDCGGWFTSASPVQDHEYFVTNNEVYLSMHPPRNVTPASYHRIRRVLGA